MKSEYVRDIALALAKANRHPAPEEYAEAAVRANDTGVAYPEEVPTEEPVEPTAE